MLKEHDIRECKVILERLDTTKISKGKLILKPNESVTVRSNVSWLPKISKNGKNRVTFADAFIDKENVNRSSA